MKRKIHINAHMELAGAKAAVKAIATFYEQSILPEVLKENDEELERLEKVEILFEALKRANWAGKCMEISAQRVQLQSQLSQLQSKMEEEKRRAFEAGIAEGYAAGANDEPITKPFNLFEEWLSSTQSTESGNLNKQ
jgi:flagellar biosynthesis/type III secretory pathway protein FliH